MQAAAILWPAVAMAALTFVVWCRLYYVRLREMARRHIAPQALPSSIDAASLLADTRASDNFRNLFELPVLFYAVLLAAASAGQGQGAMLVLAWSFVGLRTVHSLIHCTVNKVMWRFSSHGAGAFVLWSMWALLAYRMWPR